MSNRSFWFRKIEQSWQRRTLVWLSGVSGTGKSAIVQNLPQTDYFDCNIASVRRMLEHPFEFFSSIGQGRVALDDINQIVDPKPILVTAQKNFPQIKLLITSNASVINNLSADDLTNLNIDEVWLTPMTSADLADLQCHDLQTRFLRGGLPEFLLSANFPEQEMQRWLSDFWFHSVQEVSKLERRASMQKLAEDIFAHSGETFEATKYAPAAGVSRTTVTNYLKVLEKTYLVNLVKPFNSRRATEIIAVPKVYAFDSGFVAYHRGWNQLRRTDLPLMWEHFVLNELHANLQSRQFYYWKDKRNHQVSFVFARSIRAPIAIDCAWSSADYDWSGLEAFRRQYPHGESFVVSNDVTEPFSTTLRQTTARFVPLNQIVDLLLA